MMQVQGFHSDCARAADRGVECFGLLPGGGSQKSDPLSLNH